MSIQSQPIYPDLRGASVLITGGGSGIGAALTEGFLRQGARVAFVQRSDATEFCDRMAQETGTRPLFIPCDITDITALDAAVERAGEAHGPIRVLVNNAASDARHQTATTTEADWDHLIAINLKAYFFASHAVVKPMTTSGSGSIINLSPARTNRPEPECFDFRVQRQEIHGLTKAQAQEYSTGLIRVNTLQLRKSDHRLAQLQKQLNNEVASMIDTDRDLASVKRVITNTILFLASDASTPISGQLIEICPHSSDPDRM